MTNNKLTDERLAKILAETQDAIMQHNSRQVHGSVEVNARLFEVMLMEIQLRRAADKNCFMYGIADPEGNAYLDEFCVSSDRGLMEDEASALNDSADTNGYRVVALYTALPLTDSERAELQEYRNAALVVPGDGRDQFEEWFRLHCNDEYSIVHLHRANGGANYRDSRVDLAWIAWKDSRAAMQQP